MTVHGSPAPARCRCKRTNARGALNDSSRHTNKINVRVTAVSNKRCRMPAILNVQHVQGFGFCHGLVSSQRLSDCARGNATVCPVGDRFEKGRAMHLDDSPSTW